MDNLASKFSNVHLDHLDLNVYKDSFEPPNQWIIRKNLILANYEDYHDNLKRLNTLSHVHNNIHFKKCKYSSDVTEVVKKLKGSLVR